MQRLVYSPKVYVFVKNAKGEVTDVSPYVVSGTCNRKINAVSTATIVLRNPNMMFTQPGNPTFTPMDPITMYLQRLDKRPVRTFTGFLDKAPYYQMYPGTVTLEASCTLKKLLYTYFDPALPYTRSFLQQYGWEMKGLDGTVFNPKALDDNVKFDPKKQQGSLSDLLFGTLTTIGGWKKENIYVEKLPDHMMERVAKLYKQFDQASDETKKELDTLFSNIIGKVELGGGGGGGTGSANVGRGKISLKQVAEVAYAAGFRGRDLCTAVAITIKESGGDTNASNEINGGHDGLWQVSRANGHFTKEYLLDPNNNAKEAYKLYKGRGGSGASYSQRWADWLPYSGPYDDGPGSASCKAANEVSQNPPK